MLAHKRKQMIQELVDRYRTVRVSDLSERFGISDVTIRRDLKELEEAGLLKRTHGGAMKVSNAAVEPSLWELENARVREKFQIAQMAYNQIRDNDAIMIDSSTTASSIIPLLKSRKKKNITLVTNSFRAVNDLLTCEEVEVIHIGGQLRRNLQSSIGSIAENALKTLRVDKVFIGVNGVDFTIGYTTPNLFEASIKRAMLENANERYILADSSKFHQTFLSIICPPDGIDHIITDSSIDPESVSQAEAASVDLIIAPDQ